MYIIFKNKTTPMASTGIRLLPSTPFNKCMADTDIIDIFNHILLSNILYIGSNLYRANIDYKFVFKKRLARHMFNKKTKTTLYTMSVMYKIDTVVIDLNIPIDYLLIKCRTIDVTNPIPDKTCPVCSDQSNTYTYSKTCCNCVCYNCSIDMTYVHNIKCPLCNTDSVKYKHEITNSRHFLETHPIDYDSIFEIFACIVNEVPKKSFKIETIAPFDRMNFVHIIDSIR